MFLYVRKCFYSYVKSTKIILNRFQFGNSFHLSLKREVEIKTVLCLFFISINLFASSDYICSFRNYRLDLDMTNDESTGLFITERFHYNTLYVGYVGFINRKAQTTDFHFYGNDEYILTFKNNDLSNEPEQIKGRFEGTLEGFYMVDRFSCKKR